MTGCGTCIWDAVHLGDASGRDAGLLRLLRDLHTAFPTSSVALNGSTCVSRPHLSRKVTCPGDTVRWENSVCILKHSLISSPTF